MKHIPKDIAGKFDIRSATIDNRFKKKLRKQLVARKNVNMAKSSKQSNSIGARLNAFSKMKYAPIAAVAVAMVLVGGVSAGVASSRTEKANLRTTELPTDLADVLGVNDIRTKALADVPNGVITGIELEQEEGKLVYKVKLSDGSLRLYDAKTGAAVVKSQAIETDDSVPANFTATFTVQQARDIAQNKRPGKTITKIELEQEEGKVVYSVRFSDGGRVDVDATTGAVLRTTAGSSTSASNQGSSSSSGSTQGSPQKVEDVSDDSSKNEDEKEDDHSGSNSGSGSGNSGSGNSGSNSGSGSGKPEDD